MQLFFFKENANERNESLLFKLPSAAFLLQRYDIFRLFVQNRDDLLSKAVQK